jgi:hypothetical protein
MVDLKTFSGVMDTDSPNENIGQKSIKYARNIRYRGEGQNLRIENIEGNRLIPYNQPAGDNECIGAFYDDLKQRIFECIYNSNGYHSIRITYLSDESRISLLTNGTNADMDCLDFTLDGKIYDVRMLYGDEAQGDTLYFNNSSGEPCQINIERTLAGTYGTMTRDFLEVIKYPANRPPYVIYGDDATVTVNTLRKKLFRFATRPVYYSREKSVVSIKSELTLPIGASDSTIDQDPTKNCKVSIVYETLGADVQYIELLVQISGLTDENGVVDPNNFGDLQLIQTIDKVALGLSDNDIATFYFYNNQAYTDIDPEDAIQLFDLVPLEANSLEMLNGNVPIYGGITEGFDNITMTATVASSSIPEKDTQLPYIFVGSQSGDSAFGTGNIHIVLIGTIASGYVFTFITTNETITFVSASTTTAAVITGLAAAAVVAGFTVVSSDTENLVVVKTGESLQMVTRVAPILGVTNGPVFNWNDKQAICANYFDKGGRSAGSQTIEAMSFQTVNYTESTGTPNIPQLVLSITNRPPLEAFYFTIGFTKSLAKLKFLYWVSDSTYKDTEFAYISIENLNLFIANNKSDPNKPSNSAHLAYDFSPGDRIRFIKVLSGSVNTIYTQQDFSIIGQALSPNINGTVRPGQFIKINLPTTSGTFDFGTSDFFNYEIELYTPAQSVSNSLNKFYETGERFTIGNPGTATRYHQGMTQNQTPNLSQPATFTFNKGPYYYRERNINVGAEYIWAMNAYEQGDGRTTMNWNFESSTSVDPNITPGTSPNQSLAGFNIATNTDRAILNVSSGTYTFRIKGSIVVNFNDFGENFQYVLINSNNVIAAALVPMQPIAQGPHTFNFDMTFQMVGPMRMFIQALSQGDYHNSKSYSLTEIKITRQLPFTVPVIDANYSDYFPSKLNSDGRPFIEQPYSARSYNPILLRWGKANQINTNINETSRFTTLNFDELDGAKGDIMSLMVRNRVLEVLQKRACGWFAIYAKVLQNSAGEDVITTTNEIITRNNIQYLQGVYGVSEKGSIVKSRNGYWFTDTIGGYHVRRSVDGLTPINELFFGRYQIGDLIQKYSNDYIRPNGSKAIIFSYFDFVEDQYVSFFQGGTFDGNTIEDEGLAFNEKNKGYCCFFDQIPEWIIFAEGKTFEWKAGQNYIKDNTTKYGNRFGIQTYPSVTLVFNGKGVLRKTNNTLSYQSKYQWESPINGDIKTSEFNEDTGLQQISALIAQDYKQRGNYWDADLNRDANSMSDAREALIEGDYLTGTWIEVKLTYFGDKFVSLFSVYLNDQNLPRNL